MEVHFTQEQEAQLSQIATRAGTNAERLVKNAALRLLQEEARFRAAVREGIAQADRGEFPADYKKPKSKGLTTATGVLVFDLSTCLPSSQPHFKFLEQERNTFPPPRPDHAKALRRHPSVETMAGAWPARD